MNDPKVPITEIDPELFDEALESVERHGAPKKHGKDGAPAEKSEDVHVEVEEDDSEEKASAESDRDELYDRFVRLTADFDNFRKRVQKEKADYIRYGSEDLAKELLPVLDNFERALLHAEEKTSKKGSFAEGVKMIYMQLISALERFGVKGKSALGEDFDPLIHEAMNQQPSDEYPPNKVMAEHRKAYFLHDRLIRPALVTVSTGSDQKDSQDKSEDDIETKEVVDE